MSKYYVPQFAAEAVKEIRRREWRTEELLEDSELEEIINFHFKDSICNYCETRILFDSNERALIDLFKTIILCRKAKNLQEIDNLTSEVIFKYPNLRQFI